MSDESSVPTKPSESAAACARPGGKREPVLVGMAVGIAKHRERDGGHGSGGRWCGGLPAPRHGQDASHRRDHQPDGHHGQDDRAGMTPERGPARRAVGGRAVAHHRTVDVSADDFKDED